MLHQSARRYLPGNEKLENKIRKLEQQVEAQSQVALSEQEVMMKRLQESEVSEADMIHYILTASAKKPRKAASFDDHVPDSSDPYDPPEDDSENVNPNEAAQMQTPLTPSKAELKRTLNSRIMVRVCSTCSDQRVVANSLSDDNCFRCLCSKL